MALCGNCRDGKARRKGLCDPCYQHAWRNDGKPRPETNIIKHNIRRFEDEVAADRLRRYNP